MTDGVPALRAPARAIVALVALASVLVAAPSGYGLWWLMPLGLVGGLLAIRRPRHRIGWLMLATGWAFALGTIHIDARPDQFADGSLPLPLVVAAELSVIGAVAQFPLYILLMVVFPSGRFPTGRWGSLARIGISALVVLFAIGCFGPAINVNLVSSGSILVANPLAVAPDAAFWEVDYAALAFGLSMLFLCVAAAALVVRYRRATGIEREQMRWIGGAMLFVVMGLIASLAIGAVAPAADDFGLPWLPSILGLATLPAAIGVAVLRYRLYEIDRIISRTLAYTTVTAILAGVFAAVVLSLQAMALPIIQGSEIAVAVSTLAVVALFGPLRRRVQTLVDRRFNRARYDAVRVADGFGARVRDPLDLDGLTAELISAARTALRPASASVWVRTREPAS